MPGMRSTLHDAHGSPGPPPASPVRRLVVEDVDHAGELLRQWDGIERRYVQVERGQFRNEFTVLELGEAALLRSTATPGYAMTSASAPGWMALFLLAARSNATRWCGRELAPGSLGLCRAGEAHAGRSYGAVDLLNVSVCCDALHAYARAIGRDDVGDALAGSPWPDPRPMQRQRLEDQLDGILRSASQARGPLPEAARRELVSTLLGVVLDAVAGPAPDFRAPAPTSRRRAVARAREYAASRAPHVPTVPELCAAAGVSQRTLEYAFRDQLGLRPAQFLKLHRLNAARAALRSGSPLATTVTDVALELGFWDAGHFAHDYDALFGESPSKTLRRLAR
jgi:AraC family ethanolamine operon transcriptional activator